MTRHGHTMKLSLLAVAMAGVLLQLARPAAAAPQLQGMPPLPPASHKPFISIDRPFPSAQWDMTWKDYKYPPNTYWANPNRKGSIRNFNIALITVDYDDRAFVILQTGYSASFGNPQYTMGNLTRDRVPAYYRALLNKPQALNHGHTLHEYWMEDSQGRYGVDLAAHGPYRMPWLGYQYGIDETNKFACPRGKQCSKDLRADALAAWRKDVGNATADSYELVFILTAGSDESSTWDEFGPAKWPGPRNVPVEYGPPPGSNLTLDGIKTHYPDWTNAAHTRHADWTSWASAATIWPDRLGKSVTVSESSGMAVYAHEISHLLGIRDNNNDPYALPLRRSYTGPWSIMSRGSFSGPGGLHLRWPIPAIAGGSQGSLHTMRDRTQMGLIANTSVLSLSREALAKTGPLVIRITARSVDSGIMGIRVALDGPGGDRSPYCNTSTEVLCDGGGWDKYDVEVIDRMGSDSFAPDTGVMISKTRDSDAVAPFQWTVDANPQPIGQLPKQGDVEQEPRRLAHANMGDYRQLLDALFHSGAGRRSKYEHIDEANRLHFYIINRHNNSMGVLQYTIAVRSLDGPTGRRGVRLWPGRLEPRLNVGTTATTTGSMCQFTLANNGTYTPPPAGALLQHPQDVTKYLQSDVYRLEATVDKGSAGWIVGVPNPIVAVPFHKWTYVRVAVRVKPTDDDPWPTEGAMVRLTAVSEADPTQKAMAWCIVVNHKPRNLSTGD